MRTGTAILIDGLWKEYALVRPRVAHPTLYDALSSVITAPLRRLRSLSGDVETRERFWALRDLDLCVAPGEVVGVIGRNGAGKSTLLKILSRVTAPTRGRIEVRGRLASLLEVGTGFHGELSGRENIFLNAAILGMTRRDVARRFDEIVAFAEVDDFIDTPVKRYSSGMYVRLAFAVAAHLDADVLLVDEVLAVGDESFQKKSVGRMGDVAKEGRTVLFVSHNLAAVRNLCSRAILLERGAIAADGPTGDTVTAYESRGRTLAGDLASIRFDGPLSEWLRFESFEVLQEGESVAIVNPSRGLTIEVKGRAQRSFPSADLNVALFRESCQVATLFDTPQAAPLREGPFTSRFQLPPDVLRPGRYTVGVGAVASMGNWTWGGDVASLECSEDLAGRPPHRLAGALGIPFDAERVQ